MVKKKSFKKFYKDYLEDGLKLQKYQWMGAMLLVWVIAGFVGWVYEAIVAILETGEFYMKGGDFLPWINIYAIGSVLLVPVVYKFKKYPWVVFLLSVVVTGLVELIGGWLVYTVGNGTRYWNYDHGLWAFGSINGFVCVLSVTIFGLFALMLIYAILPWIFYFSFRMSKKAFLILAVSLFVLVMADELTNLTLKNTDHATAMDFYRSLGMKYQEF